jgi:hypothetical protein
MPPQALNARVTPELAAIIERLMAQDPEARGSAREIAEAAESAAEHSGPAAAVPLLDSKRPKSKTEPKAVPLPVVPETVPKGPAAVAVPAHVHTGMESRSWDPRRVLFATFLFLALAATCWMAPDAGKTEHEWVQVEPLEQETSVTPDEDPTGLADGGVPTRVTSKEAPLSGKVISLDMPKQPLPGQRRAPCKRRGEVEINGGCWTGLLTLTPPCGDEAYEWSGICYWPVLVTDRPRVPTTDKQEQ